MTLHDVPWQPIAYITGFYFTYHAFLTLAYETGLRKALPTMSMEERHHFDERKMSNCIVAGFFLAVFLALSYSILQGGYFQRENKIIALVVEIAITSLCTVAPYLRGKTKHLRNPFNWQHEVRKIELEKQQRNAA